MTDLCLETIAQKYLNLTLVPQPIGKAGNTVAGEQARANIKKALEAAYDEGVLTGLDASGKEDTMEGGFCNRN